MGAFFPEMKAVDGTSATIYALRAKTQRNNFRALLLQRGTNRRVHDCLDSAARHPTLRSGANATQSAPDRVRRTAFKFVGVSRQRVCEHTVVRQNNRALNEVLKLSYIPGPRVSLKRPQRSRWHFHNALTDTLRVNLHEMHHQGGDIVAPFRGDLEPRGCRCGRRRR